MKSACNRLFGAFTVAVSALLTLPTDAAADTFEDIVEGAREEGRVIVVVSSPGKPESHARLAEAFNERFGLDLVVEWIPNSSVQTNTKLIAEKDRTEGSVDIVGSGGPVEVSVVLNEGVIEPYPWVETFGEQLPGIDNVVNSAMDSIRGAALAIGDAAYGLAWNPDLISQEELPNTYEELAAKEWEGRFAVNALGLYPIEYWSFVDGRDATLEFASRVLDNGPVLERGTAAATRAVSVGQAPVGISSFHQAARVDNVNFRLFNDYVPLTTLYIYVPESAPHPNAARLFSAWLTVEGISILDENEALPRILDESSDLNAMYERQKEETGVQILTERSLEDIKDGKKIRDAISGMMTE